MKSRKIKLLILTTLLTASWQTKGSSHLGHGSYGYVSETTHHALYHAIVSWNGLFFLILAVILIIIFNKKAK